jgi:LacI family transcriptional regulator
MHAAGIDIHPDWVQRGEGTYVFGLRAMARMLGLSEAVRPTAVVAMNDLMAIGALRAIRQHGLQAGKDIVVTGFDDTPIARFLNPPLTSVRQPIWDIGQHLMERLIISLQSGEYPPPVNELVAPVLVIRSSSTGIETEESSN